MVRYTENKNKTVPYYLTAEDTKSREHRIFLGGEFPELTPNYPSVRLAAKNVLQIYFTRP